MPSNCYPCKCKHFLRKIKEISEKSCKEYCDAHCPVTASKIALHVKRSKLTDRFTANTNLVFDQELLKVGDIAMDAEGLITIPVDGLYYMSWTLSLNGPSTVFPISTAVAVNGEVGGRVIGSTQLDTRIIGTEILDLKKDDKVAIFNNGTNDILLRELDSQANLTIFKI